MPKTRAGWIAFPGSLEMDIHQLELFLAVMDSSSVTGAAEHFHWPPAEITLHPHSPAGEPQTELFVRSGRRLIPPPAASRLAERARALIKQAHQMRHDFENNSSTDARPFHFATGITSLIYRLGRPLRLLREQFPNTEIQIFVGVTEEIVAGLLDSRFDLGLISLPVSQKNLKIMPLFEEALLLLRPSPPRVSRGHAGPT